MNFFNFHNILQYLVVTASWVSQTLKASRFSSNCSWGKKKNFIQHSADLFCWTKMKGKKMNKICEQFRLVHWYQFIAIFFITLNKNIFAAHCCKSNNHSKKTCNCVDKRWWSRVEKMKRERISRKRKIIRPEKTKKKKTKKIKKKTKTTTKK